ncbi:MAG: cation:proton antiporter [Rhodovibrionaceae bacterium]|nr:cation:proton antiporter [Rhodovibrionaceae bacterium]
MIADLLHGDFLEVCASIGFVLLGLALILSFLRILSGPTLADRVVAIDLLTILAMGFIGLRVLVTGETLFLEIAIALGLVGFIATVFFARLVEARVDPYTREAENPKSAEKAAGEKERAR